MSAETPKILTDEAVRGLRRGHHDGLRRHLPDLPRQALRGLEARRPRRPGRRRRAPDPRRDPPPDRDPDRRDRPGLTTATVGGRISLGSTPAALPTGRSPEGWVTCEGLPSEGESLRVGQPTPGRRARCTSLRRCAQPRPGRPSRSPVPRTANQADSAPCRTSPAPRVSTTSTCGTGTSARPAPVSTSIGSGPRDRATTGGPRERTRAQHVIIRAPSDLVQVGGNAEDLGDHGDVDMCEELLESGLPRPAVEQYGDARGPGRLGQGERQVEVVAIEEDHVNALHERPRPARFVRGTPRRRWPCAATR